MTIQRALPSDHIILTRITKLSKAYWGYSAEQMEQWETVLTITPEYIAENETFKLVSGDEATGYYSIIKSGAETLKLDNLFILPGFIGSGCGRILMEHLFAKAVSESYTSIILEADPNAESFYSKFGFSGIGQVATSTPGRILPVMKKLL
ncbi:GNAT family N-acetyltransferase [Flavobacterium sp. MFBS3-15]|uniref:GNAT family N-acetyltransferase n=1 Tax=Flavobacterium sp. MFBS3-15 TaxID=2989816 RepID=UPI002236190D|nr:GNAT family N-acetyltransferase [Flavobacterium sp. MFBS3-15]MCW4470253.1 GNAT family N-acetyltransferase [Flavobacterium sp. MFBS3-15]